MTTLTFPNDFLWGTATAAHQVEGDNSNSDWWAWERKPGGPCVEPSGIACDHYNRYRDDLRLLGELGFNAYRFSVEWARIEPAEGTFDERELEHYRDMIRACHENGMKPMVTLNHFTLPRWLGGHGGWLSPKIPALFERYCRKVVAEIGDGVDWWCTINEPNVVVTGGYLGKWGFPPNRSNIQDFRRARRAITTAHRRASAAVKDARPDSHVGQTIAINEGAGNEGAQALLAYMASMYEDPYLEASEGDDFVGVQTYTRMVLNVPGWIAPLVGAVMSRSRVEGAIIPAFMTRVGTHAEKVAGGPRLTQMGYEYWPQAVGWTVRKVANWYPKKDIVVTEHGIATADDAERIEFIKAGLESLQPVLEEGIRLRGYVYWSAMDNFEWARGYAMTFGLIGIDRETLEREVRPSARFLGEVARTGKLVVDEAGVPVTP